MGILSNVLEGSLLRNKDKNLTVKDQISDIGSVNNIGGYYHNTISSGMHVSDPTRATGERMTDTIGTKVGYTPFRDQIGQINGIRTQFGTSINTTPGIGSRTFATMGGVGINTMSDESKKELIIKGLISFGIEELTAHQANKLGLNSRFLCLEVEPKVIKQPKRTLKL
jgi:hypothetical protein